MIIKLILVFLLLIFVLIQFFFFSPATPLDKIKKEYRLTKFRKNPYKNVSYDFFIDCIVNKMEYDRLYNRLIKYMDEVDINMYIYNEYYLHKYLWEKGDSNSSSDY